MTETTAADAVDRTGEGPSASLVVRWLLLFATPLLLGAALWFHPEGGGVLYESLAPVSDTWLVLHLALLPLFGLLGICLYVLLGDFAGRTATLGRIGVAVYLVFYVAFETIAGIATGILVRRAQSLPPEQQAGVAEALQATVEPALALGLVGTAGAVVAVAAAARLLLRSGAPFAPVALLPAGVSLTVFAHGGTGVDSVGMALFLLGVVWLELGWRPVDASRSSTTR